MVVAETMLTITMLYQGLAALFLDQRWVTGGFIQLGEVVSQSWYSIFTQLNHSRLIRFCINCYN